MTTNLDTNLHIKIFVTAVMLAAVIFIAVIWVNGIDNSNFKKRQ